MRYFLLMVALASCTAAGKSFSEIEIPSDQRSVVLYRPMAYLGSGAGLYSIDIDGQFRCKLHPGSFLVAKTDNEKINISSAIWSDPGTSRIVVNTKSRVSYIKMLPNDAKQAVSMAGGLIGMLIAEGVSNTPGQFIFLEIEPEQAKKELADLKQDCIQ